jgi:hypothetical protein
MDQTSLAIHGGAVSAKPPRTNFHKTRQLKNKKIFIDVVSLDIYDDD